MRIKNRRSLCRHGNIVTRSDMLEILEAGLRAADPYHNVRKLVRRQESILTCNCAAFEMEGDPQSGPERIDLSQFGHVYVVGAGKGVQRAAKALEDVLGPYLTGGVVISKYGDEKILNKIEVCYAAHPVPDEGSVRASRKILALAQKVTEKDLVFTVIANGASSLMTLPAEGISLADVQCVTQMLQIEKGAFTHELNMVRNHIDLLKGGKLTRLFWQARMIHLIVTDPNRHAAGKFQTYEQSLKNNLWLHNLSEGSSFEMAVHTLQRHGAWERCPESIRRLLTAAPPALETVKYEEFIRHKFRIFGVMPDDISPIEAAKARAEQLGYAAHVLTDFLVAEAREAANVFASIARNLALHSGELTHPVALLSTGELLVTVGAQQGVGGRNQEFVLAAAERIKGFYNVMIASLDTDGTDGPGGLQLDGAPDCLGGGIVDGYTAIEAKRKGLDLDHALETHNASAPLWKLHCGLHIEQSISLNDLTVILVSKH